MKDLLPRSNPNIPGLSPLATHANHVKERIYANIYGISPEPPKEVLLY